MGFKLKEKTGVSSVKWIRSVSMSWVRRDRCDTPAFHADKEVPIFKETYRKSNHRGRRLIFYSFIGKSNAYAILCLFIIGVMVVKSVLYSMFKIEYKLVVMNIIFKVSAEPTRISMWSQRKASQV